MRPFSAFSAAVAGGLWARIGVGDLALLLAVSGAILAVVLAVNAGVVPMAPLRELYRTGAMAFGEIFLAPSTGAPGGQSK